MEWMVVHGDQAEQVVVALGDGLAGPMPIDSADLEFLEIPPELHADLRLTSQWTQERGTAKHAAPRTQ